MMLHFLNKKLKIQITQFNNNLINNNTLNKTQKPLHHGQNANSL